MAVLPSLLVDYEQSPPKATSIERVEQWTVAQVADTLAAASISPPPSRQVRGTSVTVEIPLDELPTHEPLARTKTEAVHTVYKRREPIRRDSQKRREALLKGKEGSRRRQRWENDRLLSNPYVEPPLPSDWQVRPTHPVQHVPYFLAPLWDAEYARASQERQTRAQAARSQQLPKEDRAAAKLTQELRAKLKRSKASKGLLQDLEEEVRGFVRQWEEKQRQLESEGVIEPDSEDEEIVFVGRNGAMSDERRLEKQSEKLEKDKKVYESLLDDHGAAFGYAVQVLALRLAFADFVHSRYLVHAIGMYYGLKTWSVTTGDPARREAYVGLPLDPQTRRPSLARSEMPRPLWAVV